MKADTKSESGFENFENFEKNENFEKKSDMPLCLDWDTSV